MFWEETDHVLETKTRISLLVLLFEPTPLQSRVQGNLATDPFLVDVSNFVVGILLAKKSHQGNFPLVMGLNCGPRRSGNCAMILGHMAPVRGCLGDEFVRNSQHL